MITISTRLLAILTTLRQAIAAYAVQQNRAQAVVWLGATAYSPIIPPNAPARLPDETWVLLTTRLNRMAARFSALFHRWRTKTLPAPRPSRAGRPYTAKPILRLSATRGWVNIRIPASAPCTGQLETLLHDPEMPEFLAAAPQAGRILRPLCHALGLPEPHWLKRPARPAKPRPPRPNPPESGSPFRPLPPPPAQHPRRRPSLAKIRQMTVPGEVSLKYYDIKIISHALPFPPATATLPP